MADSSVRVVCRFRPQNKIEQANGSKTCINVSEDQKTVKIQAEGAPHDFTFDRIFPPGTRQVDVYNDAARPVVEDIMKGYNGTIFVYGQTGSGKTFTMQGPSIDDPEMKGIIPRMIETIFESVMNADENIEFLVKASYLEIYMEKIRDLLDPTKVNLKVREEKSKGIWVEGSTEVYVGSEQEVLDVIRAGAANRAVSSTNMNAESSRSHSIFILSVNQKNLVDLSNKTGKLFLVDLAGSEKVQKTGAQGTTLDEAKKINQSLSTLGNVINALTDGKSSHIPYRNSKLTRVLQESLGGNSKTTLIINCSPSGYNEAETLSTLRFGNRAKSIQNKAKVNQERSVGELKILLATAEKEIARLNAMIEVLRGGGALPPELGTDDSPQNLAGVSRLQEENSLLEKEIKKLEEEKQEIQDMYDEFKEKEQDLEIIDQLREEIARLKSREANLEKENEILVVRVADMSIDNEKLQYEKEEMSVSLTSVTARAQNLESEKENLSKELQLLKEKEQSKALMKEEKIEDDSEEDESETKTKDKQKDERDAEIASLKAQLEAQKREIELMKQSSLRRSISIESQETSTPKKEDVAEQEDFESLKRSLFEDLENRCKKIVELETLLNEAREQYQSLLGQVKNSNSNTLQRKVVFLQKNLDQLMKVQQDLANENQKLKLENSVNIKKIAVKNERIHGLEQLLSEQREKIQKYISASNASPRNANQLNLHHAKIVKPLRGGGGAARGNGSPTPTKSKTSFLSKIWGSSPRSPDSASSPSFSKSPSNLP